MRFNYIITDSKNTTLWVRSRASCTPAQAYESLAVLRKQFPMAGLHLLESEESSTTGKELAIRFVLPYAKAAAEGVVGPAAAVEVWHRTAGPSLDDYSAVPQASLQLAQADYSKVAEVLCPAGNAYQLAFELTQNLDGPWNPKAPTRSTSVGDVLVLRTMEGLLHAFCVSPIGWTHVADFH